MCSDLWSNSVEVEIMWIPSHVGLEGYELVDERVRRAPLNFVFSRPLPPVDFQGLEREWQRKWNAADTGRFTHSVLPRVLYSLTLV
jgi:hypothetical protein